MHKKIIGILVVTLLIVSMLPMIKSLEITKEPALNIKDVSTEINYYADAPVWENGDYWSYDIEMQFTAKLFSGLLKLNDLHFEVTYVGSEYYLLEFDGIVTGSISIVDIIEGSIQNSDIGGTVRVRKSDMAMEEILNLRIEGEIERTLVTNSFSTDIGIKQNISPIVSPYDFPIEVEETWVVPITSIWTDIEAIFDLAISVEFNDYGPLFFDEHTFTCIGKETVRVPAGRFNDSFHAKDTTSNYQFWYSPTARNVIRLEYENVQLYYNESSYWNISQIEIELKNTNYKPANDPPNEPTITGTIGGNIGTSYTYSASTIDKEEDRIYYLFDWGDGINTGWMGPYQSGRKASTSHSWTLQGTYNVKVKAKDEWGAESDWTTLEVSMPKIKPYFNQPFFWILERHPNLLPLMKILMIIE